MQNRRGQDSASGAAILVGLIGLLLIGYILILPPDARSELLTGSGNPGYGSGGGYGGAGGGTGPLLLMVETPGTLLLQSSPVVEHTMPSTVVFTSLNTVAVKELSSLYLKNSVFSRQGASMTFQNDGRASNYLLSFNVDEAQGNLIIQLNGREIYNQVVTDRSPQPIILPQDMLIEGQNEIVFIVGDVGLKFWTKNEYQLRKILISADTTDFRGATSEQHFTIPEQEHAQLEYAQLEFIPECDPAQTGRLIIETNRQLSYSGYPDCGVLNRVDIAKERLRAGDNNVVFVADQGSYLLDRISVTSYLKEQDYPLYYVNIPLELYEPIDIGDAELLLTMRFADYRSEKRGEVVINGFAQTFTTDQLIYQAVLDPNIIMPGPNTIQILPHVSRLNIAEIKIELV